MPIRLKPTRRRLLFGWRSVHLAYCFPSVSKNWIPDSLSAELGFRVTIVNGILDSLSCIPDSTVNKHISYIEKLSLRASFWRIQERARARNISFWILHFSQITLNHSR